MKVKGKERKLPFYEPNTPGDKLILVGPVWRVTDNGQCDTNGPAARREQPGSGLWAASHGLGREWGVSKATSRDGKKGEAALHPEILTPIPKRQLTAGRVGDLSDPVQWKGKGCGQQADRDQRGRVLAVESIAEAVTPCRVPEVSKSLTSPPSTPGSFPGTFPFCQEHILCFAAGGFKPCAEILFLPHACFQNRAGFHFLSRSSSAFVTYVNLLWENHRKANYCPDTVFRQTSNVSPGSECGISDSPSLCQWVIRARVATRAGCA